MTDGTFECFLHFHTCNLILNPPSLPSYSTDERWRNLPPRIPSVPATPREIRGGVQSSGGFSYGKECRGSEACFIKED